MNGLVSLALRGLWRDWRSGELVLISVALVLAVAAVAGVDTFRGRITAAMAHYGVELIGGDLVVEGAAPPGEALLGRVREAGLAAVRTVEFPSVVLAGERTALVQVKAVDPGYPLRGRLRTAASRQATDRETEGIPPPGAVWVERRLLDRLALSTGGQLELGTLSLRIDRILSFEPDRAGQLFQLAPRVLLNRADLEATGLVSPQSRVRHRLLVAGPQGAVAALRVWLHDHLPAGLKLRDSGDLRPTLRIVTERVHTFLMLAALVAVLIAGVAIALSARHYVDTRRDSSALMRCLGASSARVLAGHLLQFMFLGVAAGLVGTLLGYLAQFGLSRLLQGWFLDGLPTPATPAIGLSLGCALILLLGFAFPPLIGLSRIPPLRVLRRQAQAPRMGRGLAGAAVLLALGALVYWQLDDVRWAGAFVVGVAITAALLWAVARLLIRAMGGVLSGVPGAARVGLARVVRRPDVAAVQVAATALGIATLLVLGITRQGVLTHWRATVSPQAPNRFLFNIQEDERQDLARTLAGYGVHAPLYPMIRGRWVSHDGRPVDPDRYVGVRARRLAGREFNLSTALALKADNRIVDGRWWGERGAALPAFSVESGIARELGIGLGDLLGFEVAGQRVEAPVTSLRDVEWGSFQPNFFVLGTPALLKGLPGTWITAVRMPAESAGLEQALVREFPSVTVIDVEAILDRVVAVMDQGAHALEFVFAFTLVCGIVVLFAAIQADQVERRYEIARLRVLGARRSQMARGLIAEFAAGGLVAGTLAAGLATLGGYLMETRVLDLRFHFEPAVWAWGLGGGLMVGLSGLWGTWGVLHRPPGQVLKGD